MQEDGYKWISQRKQDKAHCNLNDFSEVKNHGAIGY